MTVLLKLTTFFITKLVITTFIINNLIIKVSFIIVFSDIKQIF